MASQTAEMEQATSPLASKAETKRRNRKERTMLDPRMQGHEPDDEVVTQDNACPGCGENRLDWLAWDEDGTVVTCATCGASYDPSEV